MIKIILFIFLTLLLLYLLYKNNNKDFFANVEILNDFYLDSNQVNLNDKSVNSRRICIFEKGIDPDNPSNEKILDFECIDSNQLLSTLNMTSSKKKMVCVDQNCLNKNDVKVLNGTESFKIKNNSKNPFWYNNCISEFARAKLRRCGTNTRLSYLPQFVNTWWNKMHITYISPISCDHNLSKNFRLQPGLNMDKNLKRNNNIVKNYGETAMPRRIGINEGHY